MTSREVSEKEGNKGSGWKVVLMYVQLRWQLEYRSVKSGWNYSGCLYMALFFLATCNGKKV